MTKHGPSRKFTPEQEQAIVDRYNGGESIGAIGRSIGAGTMTVQRTLQRLGVQARHDGRSLTDEERRLVDKMHETGFTIVNIAKHFNVNKKTIARVLRRKK